MSCKIMLAVIWFSQAVLGLHASAGTVRVSGVVLGEGRPLPNARIVAAIPSVSMNTLGLIPGEIVRRFEAFTDADGKYEIEIDVQGSGSFSVSFDARCAGYHSAGGMLMRGGAYFDRTMKNGDHARVDFELREALYLSGIVSTKTGQPVGSAIVTVWIDFDRAGREGRGFIAGTTSKGDGTFEIFDVPLPTNEPGDCAIEFKHPDYGHLIIRDIRRTARNGQINISPTLSEGCSLTGRVLHADGKPAKRVFVRCFRNDEPGRDQRSPRATTSNERGEYVLNGLLEGAYTIESYAPDRYESARFDTTVHGELTVEDVKLQQIESAGPLRGASGLPNSGRVMMGIRLEPPPGRLQVRTVSAGSPAEIGGLKPGDVITGIDGTAVEQWTELIENLSHYSHGDIVSVAFLRDDSDMSVRVKLESEFARGRKKWDKAFGNINQKWRLHEEPIEILGMKLATVTSVRQRQYGLPSRAGVVVTGILRPSLPFSTQDVRIGDVFNNVRGNAVADIVDFVVFALGRKAKVRDEKTARPIFPEDASVRFGLRRVENTGEWGTNTQYLVLDERDWRELESTYGVMCGDR